MSNQFKNEDPNTASSDKWRLVIGDLILLSRRVHDFSVPGIYSEGIDGPSPGPVLMAISSERVTFDPVIFTYSIDSKWENWSTLWQWVRNNAEADQPVTKDIIIELLDQLNRPMGLKITLIDARPTALDNVVLDTDAQDPRLVNTVTLKYQDIIISRS